MCDCAAERQRGVEDARAAERGGERVDAQARRQVIAVDGPQSERLLRRIGVAGGHGARVDREAQRVVPGGAVEPLQAPAGEHVGHTAQRRQLAAPDPPARLPARGQSPEVRLGRGERRRRGGRVERVAVLARVRHPHGRLEARREEPEVLRERRRAGSDPREHRPARVEQAGERRPDPAEREPRRPGPEVPQRRLGLRRGDRGTAAAAVDEHETREVARARPSGEGPRRVGRRDGAAQGVAAEHHLAAAAGGAPDDAPEVLDLRAHPPVAGEADLGIGDEPEVGAHARVLEVAEVVVEELPRRGLPRLGPVEHAVVLEQVLAALDGPDLPALRARHDAPGERQEVRRARRGPGIEDEHVPGAPRADLEHADAVVPRRRAGSGVALDAREAHGRARCCGSRCGEDGEERDESAARQVPDHRADASARQLRRLPGNTQHPRRWCAHEREP